jgi:very-short-patch-repair endonuclease
MAAAAATGTHTVYLDLAFPRERVAVELDGAAYHSAPDTRERDLRRDAALSAREWVVLRFSHRRLHAAPDAVRDELADVLMTRRLQLGVG